MNNEQFFFKAVLLIISLPIVAGAIIILHTVDLYKNLENSRIQFAENPLWTLFLLPRTVCLQARVNNVEINHRDSGRTVWTLRQPTLIPWFPFHPLPQLPLRSPNLSNLLSSFPPFAISALAHTHTHAYTLSISSHGLARKLGWTRALTRTDANMLEGTENTRHLRYLWFKIARPSTLFFGEIINDVCRSTVAWSLFSRS